MFSQTQLFVDSAHRARDAASGARTIVESNAGLLKLQGQETKDGEEQEEEVDHRGGKKPGNNLGDSPPKRKKHTKLKAQTDGDAAAAAATAVEALLVDDTVLDPASDEAVVAMVRSLTDTHARIGELDQLFRSLMPPPRIALRQGFSGYAAELDKLVKLSKQSLAAASVFLRLPQQRNRDR